MDRRYPDTADDSSRFQLQAFSRGGLAAQEERCPKTVGQLVRGLSALFDPRDAEPWDRTGLLVGDPSAPLAGVACALDATFDAVCRAEAFGANVLLTHHPAYLDPPAPIGPRASGATAAGEVVYEAVRRGIALVNYHTALDVSAPAQKMLPGLLGLVRTGVLDPLGRDEGLGYGQICAIAPSDAPMTLESLSLRCTAVFGRAPRVWGDMNASVTTAATWTGSAGPACELCLAKGVEVLVCGEVKYHTALDAASAGLSIIELGHDVSELPFAAVLAEAVAGLGVSRESITCLAQDCNWSHPESRRV
ncbi:MAG: Nif3-like dinuclear metal center hexameric protein [Slackia sp.]|nr:Nif3-like dinuclear metal center hexameric protein [Slackia sp.]